MYGNLCAISDNSICTRIEQCRLVFPLVEAVHCYSSIK
jgi:hypothetical protein